MTALRILLAPLTAALLSTAALPALADDGSPDLPCNSLCRIWLGVTSQTAAPELVRPEPEAVASPASEPATSAPRPTASPKVKLAEPIIPRPRIAATKPKSRDGLAVRNDRGAAVASSRSAPTERGKTTVPLRPARAETGTLVAALPAPAPAPVAPIPLAPATTLLPVPALPAPLPQAFFGAVPNASPADRPSVPSGPTPATPVAAPALPVPKPAVAVAEIGNEPTAPAVVAAQPAQQEPAVVRPPARAVDLWPPPIDVIGALILLTPPQHRVDAAALDVKPRR